MSKFYAESNHESTIELYNKRILYKNLTINSVENVRNIVDLNMGERCLYGKVDQYYSPMFIRYPSRLKTLRTEEDNGPPFMALNFVADLFNAMSLEFDRCTSTGQISADETYLSSLKVFKAYQDPVALYKNYEKTFINGMARKFLAKKIRVENFEHFVVEFMKIMRITSHELPFTFPAFVKSRLNNVLSTGLAIEIADLSHDNDEDKKLHFVKSKNWKFFVNACNKFGFMIDYNSPWRIICDIKAPGCKYYFQHYYKSHDELMQMGFSRASSQYLRMLPRQLLDVYNAVKRKSIRKQTVCSGRVRYETIRPPSYTVREITSKYSYEYFVEMYVKLRLMEERPDYSNTQTKSILKDVLLHMKNTDDDFVFETHFERLINKPFDKPYSMTYNVNTVLPARGLQPSPSGYTMRSGPSDTSSESDSGY